MYLKISWLQSHIWWSQIEFTGDHQISIDAVKFSYIRLLSHSNVFTLNENLKINILVTRKLLLILCMLNNLPQSIDTFKFSTLSNQNWCYIESNIRISVYQSEFQILQFSPNMCYYKEENTSLSDQRIFYQTS